MEHTGGILVVFGIVNKRLKDGVGLQEMLICLLDVALLHGDVPEIGMYDSQLSLELIRVENLTQLLRDRQCLREIVKRGVYLVFCKRGVSECRVALGKLMLGGNTVFID